MKECCRIFKEILKQVRMNTIDDFGSNFCSHCGGSLEEKKPKALTTIPELGWVAGFDPKGQYCKFIDCDARKKINEIVKYLMDKI